MKAKIPNTLRVWKQIDDELVARLRLSVSDRAAYCYLLRHSRLEARCELRFSVPWLARGIRMSAGATRQAVRRLLEKGALRLVERTKAGHVAEVRLPEEIPAAAEINFLRLLRENDLEDVGFLSKRGTPRSHPCARGRAVFLLSAASHPRGKMSGPPGATGSDGPKHIPQPGLVLPRMQFSEGRTQCRRLSEVAFP